MDISADMLKGLSSAELIRLHAEGSSRAFGVLIERYELYIRSVIRKCITAQDSEDDIYQDICEHLYKKLRNKSAYHENGHFSAWLQRTIYNFICSNVYRKKNVQTVPLLAEYMQGEGIYNEESTVFEKEKKVVALYESLDVLPPNMRYIVRMKMWGEWSFQKISDYTGIKKSTVVVRLRSALKILRKAMKAKGYDDSSV